MNKNKNDNNLKMKMTSCKTECKKMDFDGFWDKTIGAYCWNILYLYILSNIQIFPDLMLAIWPPPAWLGLNCNYLMFLLFYYIERWKHKQNYCQNPNPSTTLPYITLIDFAPIWHTTNFQSLDKSNTRPSSKPKVNHTST